MAAVVLLLVRAREGVPSRLVVGPSDTVAGNSRRSTQLPVRVFDRSARELDLAPQVRWARTSAAPVPVSLEGTVMCTEAGDAIVRAALGPLVADVIVLGRPVHALRSLRRVQLVLGESAQRLRPEALGADSLPIGPLAGRVTIVDSTIATIEGLTVRQRSLGATTMKVRIGDDVSGASVEVYEPVSTLDGLASEQHLVAVPLRLGAGEIRRCHLASASYLVAVLPAGRGRRTPLVACVGANGAPLRGFGEQQYHCLAGGDAAVVAYHPSGADSASLRVGHLALRRLGPSSRTTPSRCASERRVARSRPTTGTSN